jgi:DNA topoisomerase-1
MPSRPLNDALAPGPSANGGGRAQASAAGLVYVSDADPGFRRIRRRDGFGYVDAKGRPLTDVATLRRIARLAVPPAYEDVWICADPCGHLQATGRDARGRKQYRYHPEWRRVRDDAKFARMAAFGAALGRLRRRVRRDLALQGWPREKVLAMVAGLLDATRVRIGNAEYVRANGSFGLTTLRNRHLRRASGGALVLRFRGKGGAQHEIAVGDGRLARLVRRCHELPGQRLFQYVDADGEVRPVDSGQVNLYLKEAMGDAFTAKDFRTWGATVRAAALMHATPFPASGTQRAQSDRIVSAIRTVAAELGNTPAVCRKSYINPVVFDAWRSGALHALLGSERATERRIAEFLRRAQSTSSRATPRRSARKHYAEGAALPAGA